MFYTKGIDITNDKQMFNFLKSHFTYWTMNSWNRLWSIANDVKLYNLKLSGDWSVALDLLDAGEYENINWMIQDWAKEHSGYEVCFNGRCGGYLVLMNNDNNSGVLPEAIDECEDYEEYKRYCKEFYGSVKANRAELVYYTKLVQDFDKLCDQLRNYCDELSNLKFEVIEMQKAVDNFNEEYADDLEILEFDYLRCDDEGIVDISEIIMLKSLHEAFLRLAKRDHYNLVYLKDNKIKLAAQ